MRASIEVSSWGSTGDCSELRLIWRVASECLESSTSFHTTRQSRGSIKYCSKMSHVAARAVVKHGSHLHIRTVVSFLVGSISMMNCPRQSWPAGQQLLHSDPAHPRYCRPYLEISYITQSCCTSQTLTSKSNLARNVILQSKCIPRPNAGSPPGSDPTELRKLKNRRGTRTGLQPLRRVSGKAKHVFDAMEFSLETALKWIKRGPATAKL